MTLGDFAPDDSDGLTVHMSIREQWLWLQLSFNASKMSRPVHLCY
jgi:hypothetical protein